MTSGKWKEKQTKLPREASKSKVANRGAERVPAPFEDDAVASGSGSPGSALRPRQYHCAGHDESAA